MSNLHLQPHRGAIILVLGILSWVGFGIFTSPFAWIMGKNDLAEMDAGQMDPEGRSITQVGMILGMIMTILFLIGVAIFVAMLVLGLGFAAASATAS